MGNLKGVKKVVRLKSALERLEVAYIEFKATGEDKQPWESTRNGRKILHRGRSYNEECQRMKKEMESLKAHIAKNS